MDLKVSSGTINKSLFNINSKKKILIAGPAINTYKAREIILPVNKNEVLSLYGESPIYDAYCLLIDNFNLTNVYVSNCFANSDYIRLTDKIIHYDFDFFAPIGIYFGDKFYNPLEDKDQYYNEYILTQLSIVKSLTTLIMTERHASLYEDFDHYISSMNDVETFFMENHNFDTSDFLNLYGNNLLFIYNNLKDIPHANVVLAGLFANRDYAKYLTALKMNTAVFDIDSFDIMGLRAMYFKNNTYVKNITVENTFNFRSTQDIYSNALIDDIIKSTIKSVDLESFKGKLYNQYTALQIESTVNNSLKVLNGVLFKEYTINKIGFKKTEIGAGAIIVDFSIVPFGTLESLNVVMGV
ncbi:MAG: hypothetical protein RR406_00310 [Bacilli bacterium]